MPPLRIVPSPPFRGRGLGRGGLSFDRDAIVSLIVGLSFSFATAAGAEPDFLVESRMGPAITIPQFEIANSVVTPRGGQPIPLSDVISLRRTDFFDDWSQRTVLIWLSNGDRIVGRPVEVDEDSLTVQWLQFPANDLLAIPLEYVAALSLQTPASVEGRQKLFRLIAMDTQRGDVAWLVSGDRVSGEFEGLSQGEFLFRTETGKLPILREKLLAIRFDPELVAKVKPPATRYLLSFADGTRLTAQSVERNQAKISFTAAFGAKVSLPAEELVGIQVFSAAIQPLAARKPAAVEFTPYLSGDWPWVKDRNVLYGPLQIRGREFVQGLGVHSRTALSYAIEPQDREFRAVVGIDDLADEGGQVIFQVAVDDRVVWESPGITGLTEPVAVPPINLRGGKRLTLTVDFGEFGDVRDYADWCDPIILRDE